MDRKRIKVLSPGDAETIFCMGRIPALHQIVAELLENGYDANPRQIKVIVTSLPQLKVEVFDDGCGIPMYDFPLVGTLHGNHPRDMLNSKPLPKNCLKTGVCKYALSILRSKSTTWEAKAKVSYLSQSVDKKRCTAYPRWESCPSQVDTSLFQPP
ncbi:hypothetical protein DSO57_1023905 [Entomophthora muscae]|uniref:Uncharacterized protein n=1 Tax=Entomophthora muscae TaxID=34485 RepID=A0ACC2T324_9FUNG|nr:hypothetical protein DSO57_1023905 [Entomophthora muscae]